jgi:signal transduction histidine kinase/CheY-like chemotaxis protein
MITLQTLVLTHERHTISGRRAARNVARLLGFEHQDQIRVATAVSELMRAAAGSDVRPAVARFLVDGRGPSQRLVISVSGGGLRQAPGESAGLGARSHDAKDAALLAARRLLERFEDSADASADTLSLALTLPRGASTVDETAAQSIRKEIESLDAAEAGEYLAELKHQNSELSSTLLELERKQQELTRLNAELADTNRGVMALYAELDERANHLRRADELKTKFLSYMSHEFRTPLNSILALSNMLLEHADGPLNKEQAKQVRLMRNSSAELFELVSDLLDLAKVEAGKAPLNIGRFGVDGLFGALRGMLRPLLRSPSVSLEFEVASDLPPILGDEGKVAQVLRNFLSNALKFTKTGSVRADARLLSAGQRPPGRDRPVSQDSVLFCVADTGIGISRADQEMIFEEFAQVRHSLQRDVRGTGLGLPLCRKLASLLGGEVWVDSTLGTGSRFYLLVPRFHRPLVEPAVADSALVIRRLDEGPVGALPLLILSDLASRRRALEELFADSGFTTVPASAADVSPELLSTLRPRAAVMDVPAGVEAEPKALELLRQAGVPLIDASAGDTSNVESGERFGRNLIRAAYGEVLRARFGRVLVVDDDAAFQRILTRRLEPFCREAVATADPAAAATAAGEGVDCAVLDLMMPAIDGFMLLTKLRDNAATEQLPVLVCSSKTPSADEWTLLQRMGAAFVPKSELDSQALARGLIEACLRAPAAGRLRVASGDVVGAH